MGDLEHDVFGDQPAPTEIKAGFAAKQGMEAVARERTAIIVAGISDYATTCATLAQVLADEDWRWLGYSSAAAYFQGEGIAAAWRATGEPQAAMVKAIRSAGLSQGDTAGLLGITQGRISQIERGKSGNEARQKRYKSANAGQRHNPPDPEPSPPWATDAEHRAYRQAHDRQYDITKALGGGLADRRAAAEEAGQAAVAKLRAKAVTPTVTAADQAPVSASEPSQEAPPAPGTPEAPPGPPGAAQDQPGPLVEVVQSPLTGSDPEGECPRCSHDLAVLRGRRDTLNQVCDELRSELAETRAERDVLEQQLAQVTSERDQMVDVSAELARVQEQLAQAQEQSVMHDPRLDQAQEELAAATASLARVREELAETIAGRRALETKLAEVTSERDVLEERLARAAGYADRYEADGGDAGELARVRAELERERETNGVYVTYLRGLIGALRAELPQATAAAVIDRYSATQSAEYFAAQAANSQQPAPM